MANTLTNLIPDAYEAMDIVSREQVGFVPSVLMDASAERVAVNQNLRVPVSPAAAAEDITPGTTPPDTGDQAFANVLVQITKSRGVPFRWSGEEQKGVNTGPGYRRLRVDQIAQAMRTLVNEVENDLAGLYVAASRATGTAGTTPFASDLEDSALVLQILKDNGAPDSDQHLVFNTSAGAKLRTLTQLTKANEAGSDQPLRRGVLLDVHGLALRESAKVNSHTKGTGTGYLVDLVAGYAVGDTTIHVDTGTGTIVAGDVVTFAGDTNNYLVTTGFAGDGDGNITIAEPGLRQTLADDVAMTIGNNYSANLAFHRNALVLLARAPALPEEGDMATDREVLTDPLTGMSFEFAMYPQYRRVRYEVGLSWGVKLIKPEHTAVLLG